MPYHNGNRCNAGETFAGVPFAKGVELTDTLKLLRPKEMTLAQMALRWVLDFEAVTVAIPGATTPEQAKLNCSASDLSPLPKKLHRQLQAFYETQAPPLIRGKY